MRASPRTLLHAVLALTFAASMVSPSVASAASGLPATISMDPPAAGPGEPVLVSGTDFPSGAVIELELRTPPATHALGPTLAKEEGYFSTMVTLPPDAEPGAWQLVATSADGKSASYAFNAGPAVEGAVVAAAAVGPAEPALSSGNSLSDIVVMLVLAVLIAAAIGAAAYVYYQLKLTHKQPGMALGEDPIWSGANKGADPAETATDEPAWLESRPDSTASES